jgi:hypothetical protein
MKFKLDFDIEPLPSKINHEDGLFLVGSCFAENIAAKLYENKFKIYSNPNGIVFNPISVFNTLGPLCEDKSYDENILLQSNDNWYSFHHHSAIKAQNKEELLDKIKAINKEAKQALAQAKYLVITMGSAWVYEHLAHHEIVANCHKLPQSQFQKGLLSVAEIVEAFNDIYPKIKKLNPNIYILLTVSPVKYLRDGIIENNLSKSTLLLAADVICKTNSLFYFPAFEIVNDELRDYRFYAEDMAHPSESAIQYVWERFVDACVSKESKQLMQQLDEIRKAYHHRPFNEESVQHQKFIKLFLQKTQDLQNKHPCLSLEAEISYFSV